jgi:Asp-tRNA(Asn)/Glu-tRNA(Gln) amidotransferase A subunit family amidase
LLHRSDGHAVGSGGHAVYTGRVNVRGNSAINLPCKPPRESLPIGSQLVVPYAGDELPFRVAAQYRDATLSDERWPAFT